MKQEIMRSAETEQTNFNSFPTKIGFWCLFLPTFSTFLQFGFLALIWSNLHFLPCDLFCQIVGINFFTFASIIGMMESLNL